MLFDFLAFVEELRENTEKKEVVEKYEKFFGQIQGDVKDQNFYKDYISQFKTIDYKVPEELKGDFDWIFLQQLVASSLSSEGTFDFDDKAEAPEFIITVQSGDQVVVKKISELWGFQILRLYEIYLEEQMNLQILIAEDEKEKEAILSQRDYRINRWQLVLDNLQKDKEIKVENAEKEEKLSNLYDQL